MQEVSITDIYIVVDLSYFNFLNSFLETYTLQSYDKPAVKYKNLK